MSSNYNGLGLAASNPYPWLNAQVNPLDYSAGDTKPGEQTTPVTAPSVTTTLGGGKRTRPVDNPQAPPSDSPSAGPVQAPGPTPGASAQSAGPSALDYSAGGQSTGPTAASNPAASPASDPNPYPTMRPMSNSDAFWHNLLATRGHSSTIAAILGSIGTAKSTAAAAQNAQDQAKWAALEKQQTDQARMNLEASTADKYSRAYTRPNEHPLEYFTDEGGVETPHVTFYDANGNPPTLPAGAHLYHREAPQPRASTPYDDWRNQHPNANPLDYVQAANESKSDARTVTPRWTQMDVDVPDPNNPGQTIRQTRFYDASAAQPPSLPAGAIRHDVVKAPKKSLEEELLAWKQPPAAGGASNQPPPPQPQQTAPAASTSYDDWHQWKTKDGKMGWTPASGWVAIQQ